MADPGNYPDLRASPMAEASIARDIQIESALDLDESTTNSPPRIIHEHSLTNFYRRQSYVSGTHPTILPSSLSPEHVRIPEEDRRRLIGEERSLLKDNHLLPRSKSEERYGNLGTLQSKLSKSSLRQVRTTTDEEQGLRQISETTPLLGNNHEGGTVSTDSIDIDQKWEDAILAGQIQTTWQREAKVLVRNASPLILTFVLQYSLTVASIFVIGHLGTVELGAVSLASSMPQSFTYIPWLLTHSSDFQHHWLRSVLWPYYKFRHAMCPSLWVGAKTSCWYTIAAHGILLTASYYSDFDYLV
jgi:multidrug resistance protein, MATE family